MSVGLAGLASKSRGHAEADLQREVVRVLRLALPRGSVVHGNVNEVRRGGAAGRREQAINVGMGQHKGFPDIVLFSADRVGFMELKAADGRLSPEQTEFCNWARLAGHSWALVRSLDDALAALKGWGWPSRVREGL